MQNEQLKERISALVDAEHQEQDFGMLIEALRADENKNDWEVYQHIGDILRSEDLSIVPSTDFAKKLRAQLAFEPVYPGRKRRVLSQINHQFAYAIAAMVALVAILVPQFAGNEGAEVNAPYFTGQFAAANNVKQVKPSLIALTPSQNQNMIRLRHKQSGTEVQMLRDPLVDSYLAAHQQYSKSMYSAVEYESAPIDQEVEK